jgi:hypothetical protein
VLALTDAGSPCKTNSCSGGGNGCCRIYNYLECDEDNRIPHQTVSSNQRTGIAGMDLLEKRAVDYALTLSQRLLIPLPPQCVCNENTGPPGGQVPT